LFEIKVAIQGVTCDISMYRCIITPIGLSPLIFFILPYSISYGSFSQFKISILEAIVIGNDFLSRTQVAPQLRERMDKWNYMKLKSFCTRKEMVSKFKRTPHSASYTSDKVLITRIYRELKKLNSPKINDPVKKWANELNRSLSKEEVQMAKKKPHEKMLTIPDHKENANKNHTKIVPHSC
jgi:hypothetical protein